MLAYNLNVENPNDFFFFSIPSNIKPPQMSDLFYIFLSDILIKRIKISFL